MGLTLMRRQLKPIGSTLMTKQLKPYWVDTDEKAVETHGVDTDEKAVETPRVDTDVHLFCFVLLFAFSLSCPTSPLSLSPLVKISVLLSFGVQI